MKPYIGLVSKDSESAYGIFFPDAPGCHSAADEIDDVFAMANEALAGWMIAMREEGLPIPTPRDLSSLRSDEALADSWPEAVMVIAIPAPTMLDHSRAA